MSLKTVLVVDADEDSRVIYGTILRRHGYRVLEAADGREGLRLVRVERPDLVILEFPIYLPGGQMLAAEIKRDPNAALVCVVMVTTRAFTEQREAARAAGCDGFLTKPVALRRLVAEVERVIGPPSAPSPLSSRSVQAEVQA